MSSLLFLKDHKRGKKGQGPVVVPFLEARELVNAGIAAYYGKTPDAPEAPSGKAAADHAAAMSKLKDAHAAEILQMEERHAAEMRVAQTTIDGLQKQLAELKKK